MKPHHFSGLWHEHPGRRFMRDMRERLEERDPRHHRGGRLKRLLEHGDLRLLLLNLINESPRHGYELIKAIEELTGGAYVPSPGVIYPTLTMLEEMGQVEATTEGAKKLFTITEAGREMLNRSRPVLEAMLERISLATPSHASVLPVRRAMENLRTALRMRFGGRDADAQTLTQVTEMIDDLVRKIEAL
nr:PadR family transcriptional regulator [uncultured Acidocella sp.]